MRYQNPRPHLALIGLLLLVVPATVEAWSRQGHMVTGAIAHARLQQINPAAFDAVLELLSHHPHYDSLLLPPADWDLDAADTRLATFMRAARWADDVRSEPYDDYSEGNWHYVNYHYEDGRLRPPGDPERDGYLLWALEENRNRLAQGTATERAVALTWLFHLVGDIHQPLHSVTYHAPEHPNGDRGGNIFFIRVAPNEETINLHWLWDGLVIGSDRFSDVRRRAILLRQRATLTTAALADEIRNLDFDEWASVGATLAIEHVYLAGALRSGTREAGTVLPDDYIANVQPLAERRAVLAGYRLAELLAAEF